MRTIEELAAHALDTNDQGEFLASRDECAVILADVDQWERALSSVAAQRGGFLAWPVTPRPYFRPVTMTVENELAGPRTHDPGAPPSGGVREPVAPTPDPLPARAARAR